ncbi:unnamed protein product [Ectocarpus sp. 12 AP-2014]
MQCPLQTRGRNTENKQETRKGAVRRQHQQHSRRGGGGGPANDDVRTSQQARKGYKKSAIIRPTTGKLGGYGSWATPRLNL